MFSALVFAAVVSSPCAFRPQLQLAPGISHVRVAGTSNAFTANAILTLSVRAVKQAATTADAGLRAHVAGYYAIARSLAQRSSVRAIGSSPAQARARLAKAVAALVRDANTEYARQIHIYDDVTENGRAQGQGPAYGFPGGPNAGVYCMR
ncbi:MAG TPA: hypothetical protein VFW34_08965 [Candidatus Rubrimentiphilum sp.]|nr:hypothetical protein [Candidatus Rubrimentiphilum sp.]